MASSQSGPGQVTSTITTRALLAAVAEHGAHWVDRFLRHSVSEMASSLRREMRAGNIADGGAALSAQGRVALNRLSRPGGSPFVPEQPVSSEQDSARAGYEDWSIYSPPEQLR